MICPHCNKVIQTSQIQHQRGHGLKAQFQCPYCYAWLGRSAWLMRFKMIGFYSTVILGGLAWWQPHFRHIGTPVAIMAVILMLVCHLMDQLSVIERPPQPDDTSERQKYR